MSWGYNCCGQTIVPADNTFLANAAGGSNSFAIRLPAMLGDFNGDGGVDAADYVVWRKGNGTPNDYETWRAHFGEAVPPGAGASTPANTVPEPASMWLFYCAAIGVAFLQSRRV
jgi:hypothetical protein